MDDFKLKLKRPGPIRKFDDTDLSDCQSSTESSSPRTSPPVVKSQAVLPKSVPNHLLLVSILEHLCHMYSKDSKQAQDIFYTICGQLSKANVVSPLLILDEMSSLRAQYRLSVHKMLVAAIHKSNRSLSLEFPGSKNHVLQAITYNIPSEPTSNPEDIINQTSRYKTEFVQIERIGKGGFGSVFKSRNKLDGNLYAVKKVKFKHSKPEVWYKVLREVKALACLQHYNVVGYNAAWLEYEPIKLIHTEVPVENPLADDNSSQSLDSIVFQDTQNGYPSVTSHAGPKIREITNDISNQESSTTSGSSPKCKDLVLNNNATDIVRFSTTKSVFETEFQTDFTTSRYTESRSMISAAFNKHLSKTCFVPRPEKHVEFSLTTDFTDSVSYDISGSRQRFGRSISCDPHATGEIRTVLPGDREDFVESGFALKQSVTLYIQMELCDRSLKEWLQNRNDVCKSEEQFLTFQGKNMTIFRQILKGVDFIHSQGIIHRDIKPRNIFLIETDMGIHIKIGDFGLATDEVVTSPVIEEPKVPHIGSSGKLTRSASDVSDHTSGVGTSTYAAPEQLQGSLYNTKSDIYSLGVVLYELFMQFNTESERIRRLEDLRKGLIDDKIYKYWPAQARCIEQMTLCNLECRPSIKDLLIGELFLSKDQIIEDLKAKNTSQQLEIVKLRKLLAERDRTIDELTSSLNPFVATHTENDL